MTRRVLILGVLASSIAHADVAQVERVQDGPAIDQAPLAPTALVTSSALTIAVGLSQVRASVAYRERLELTVGVSALQLGNARAKVALVELSRLHVAASAEGLYARDGAFGGGSLIASMCVARCRTVFSVSAGALAGAHTTWTGTASAIIGLTRNVKLVGELDLYSEPIDEALGRSFAWYGVRIHTRRVAYELGFDVGTDGALFNIPLFNLVVST